MQGQIHVDTDTLFWKHSLIININLDLVNRVVSEHNIYMHYVQVGSRAKPLFTSS